MHQKWLLVGLAATVAACSTTDDKPPQNPQAVVNERVAIMKGFVTALAASSQFAQGKGKVDVARERLAISRAGAGRLERLFPRGTALGDRGVTDSRALSTIFTNRADFEQKLDRLADALTALESGLERNAKADVAAALTPTKKTCLDCHSRFRTPDEP